MGSALSQAHELEETMDFPMEKLSSMTPEQERQFWEQFERDLDSDTGEAAQEHLAAGHPIYYGDPAYPGHVVKQYPDGRRQLVDFDLKTGVETVIQDL
jgi:hypothetical protein